MSTVSTLAALHQIDVDVVGLGDLARRDGYARRQINRWTGQWLSSKTRELDDMDRLGSWLDANIPAERPAVIVHGDFRLGNFIHHTDGSLAAVLDWELCTLGEPLADLAYLLRTWVDKATTKPAAPAPPTAAGWFPSRSALIERYATLTGTEIGDLDYWMAFNAWRSAAIVEGVLRRYVDRRETPVDRTLDDFRASVESSVAEGLRHAGLQS